jgi:predicted extracellular nuclease
MHRTARTLLLSLAATFAFASTAGAASPNLVVSQVYGGGGNSGATHTHDFIELFNRGNVAVPLGGKSLQYASATGTGNLGANDGQLTTLPDVMLEPGQYFLVQEGPGGGAGAALPEPVFADPTPISMAAGAGKVAIADGTTSLGCNGGSTACTPEQLARIIDLIGYGNANFFEGGAAAPTLTNTTAALRAGAGCTDTDQNGADFAAGTPSPRTTASTRVPCGGDDAPSVTGSTPASGGNDVAFDSDVEVTFSEPVTTDASAFSISCEDSGAHAVTVSGGPTTFTLDPAGSFARGEVCTVTVAAGGVHDVDTADPPDTMAGNATIRFTTIGLEGLRIHDIQGDAHLSSFDGEVVTGVAGVVTARRTNGFYLQDPNPDRDSETSEGILVFTGGAPPATAAVGASVRVSGRVDEFRFADAPEDLTVTEIVQPTVTPVSTGSVQPTVVGKGGRRPPSRVIDDDSRGDVDLNPFFDPREDGIDFHESLEGMLVRINDAVAVGPTNGFNETAVVGDRGKYAGLRTPRGGVLVRPFDFNPERLILDDVISATPDMNVGDTFAGPITAVVDYSFGNFKYLPLTAPVRVDGGLEREVTDRPGRDELSVGSFNVENLTPTDAATKYRALAEALIVNMRAPDIVAVEEIQDNDGATNSAVTAANLTWERLIAEVAAAGGPTYDYRQIDPVDDQDGGQPGGNIRVGFLFRTDRGLSFVDRPGGTPTSAVGVVETRRGAELTFSPGRIEPADPAWNASRKPLAGEFRWRGETVIAVANHFNSKGGDDPLFGRFQPPVRHTEVQRHQQARLVNEFAEDVLDADRHANLIVLGDLNDFDFSETLDILEGRELFNLMRVLPPSERYSYVFDGNSQVLDQILVSDALRDERPEYDSVHMNAEFADQISDHDPQVARLEVDD